MHRIYTYIATMNVLLVPTISRGATLESRDFKGLVKLIVGLIDILIYVLFALALVVFLWGLVNSWIIRGGDEEGVANGKKYMEAGLIGFVVMTGLWGIVYIIKNSLFGG